MDTRRADVRQLVEQSSWQALDVDTEAFVLRAYVPSLWTKSDELSIYIEGDGLAWVSESQPSSDPTPRHALALQLATLQPDGNAVYLARPCQFVEGAAKRNCDSNYWTGARFAPEVIESMNRAVDELKLLAKAQRLRLLGYSGGGAIAALLAADRKDVVQLITIAGNLDHAEWTNMHRLSPLAESLNPADAWKRLSTVAQIHFVGEADKTMPSSIAQAYLSRFGNEAPITLVSMAGFDHQCCWVKKWPSLWLQINPRGIEAKITE